MLYPATGSGEVAGAFHVTETAYAPAAPVPLKEMEAVGLVEELLVTVNWPVAEPAVVGSNSTLRVADWLGFSVRGKLAPEKENPVPEMVAELTVTGAVPDEVRVSDCVDGEFKLTSPKATLLALMVSVDTVALNCRANVCETLPAVAVRVTD
jgi:hypothetical protein